MVSKILLLCFVLTVVSAIPAAQPVAGGWGPGAAMNPWLAWQSGQGANTNPWIPPWLSGGAANPWNPWSSSGAVANPWIPSWASSGPNAGGAASPWTSSGPSVGGAANPWVSPRISSSPWYPRWTPCATIGSDCLDCSTRVVCTKVGGIQSACSGTLPYCNLGECSTTPSAQCSPISGMSAADAEDEVV